MVIYADIVFFANFIFNAGLLFALYKFRSRKIRPFRLLTAALLGGGLGVAVLIPYLQPFLSAAARYLFPFIMSAICFAPCNLRTVVLGGIYLLALSFLFAGLMEFFGLPALFGVFIVLIAGLCFDKIKKASAKKRKQTVLVYKGRRTCAEGFSDSGNLLSYKGIPVILAKHIVFEKLFGNGFNIGSVYEWVDKEDFKYVSYSALGKDGVIPAVLIDSVIVDGKVFDKVFLGYLGENFSEQLILASVMV